MSLGVGLLGLGTVGTGVAGILLNPEGRQPLVRQLQLRRIGVRNLEKPRAVPLPPSCLTDQLEAVVDDPGVDVVVEMLGGLEPARRLILRAIGMGKPVVTANKAVIAHHGVEINAAAAQAGVYVLMEAAVGGGIPIIEPLKQSLGANRIQRITGIINGTTNYILTRMASEGAAFADVLADAQALGYAEADPTADVEGHDAADKITIMAGLAYGGAGAAAAGAHGRHSPPAGHGSGPMPIGWATPSSCWPLQPALNRTRTEPGCWMSMFIPRWCPRITPWRGSRGSTMPCWWKGNPWGQVMFYGPWGRIRTHGQCRGGRHAQHCRHPGGGPWHTCRS